MIVLFRTDGIVHLATFEGCTSLKKVLLPDLVYSILDNAFERCTNLESITIPISVTNIYSYAFADGTNLKYMLMSDYVELDDSVFEGYTSLYLDYN